MAIADHQQETYQREMLDVVNPVTNDVIGQIPVNNRDDVAAAAERARFAQRAWGALTVRERTIFIQDWLDLMWEKQDEIIRILRSENGKTDSGAFIELTVVDSIAQYYIHRADDILKPQRRRTLFPLVQWGKVFRKPHGVVGVISPWNYPFLLTFIDCIPALIAGNTVLLKPSEITPYTAEYGVELMYEVGIPRDVIQMMYGDGRTGEAVVEAVDYLHFTGSTEVGRTVARRCGERLTPHSLELGGKDPAIVLDDADLDQTAVALIQGAFENTGQTCVSIERVYAVESIYEPLLERLQHYAAKIVVSPRGGLDVTVGSMTNEREFERARQHIQDALDKGATIIYGGEPRPDIGRYFFQPTILTDVDHSMDIMQIESFAPLLPVMKVKDIDEAIALANDTTYGLSASIFTRDLKRAEKLAMRIETGDVAVNRAQYVIGSPGLPSGGQKGSGYGRRNGPEGLLKYTYSQSVQLDTLLDKRLFPDDGVAIATPTVMQLMAMLRKLRRILPFL